MASKISGLRNISTSSFLRNSSKATLARCFGTSAAYQESLYNVPETKVLTVPNGLKVATENSGIPTATPGMAKLQSSSKNPCLFQPPLKMKKSHHDAQPTVNKETVLQAMADVEEEIGKLKLGSLQERLKVLREQVKVIWQSSEDELKRLYEEMLDLKAQVEMLSSENESLKDKLAVAQATWQWEAHLARFVVPPTETIYQYGRFGQMTRYLRKLQGKDNLWKKIQDDIGRWTDKHWEMVNTVRNERTIIAHPTLAHLDVVESELTKMDPEYHESMRNMLDILKLTASLMKYGRLTKFCVEKNYLSSHSSGIEENVLKNILSWDREFEQIDGLQNIEHDEAMKYLTKHVNDPKIIHHYAFVVDSVKDGNSRRLGKLAWKIGERDDYTERMATEEKEALDKLKRLLPKNDRSVSILDSTMIAKLHIPDFLPKYLWEFGVKIVENNTI